MLNEKEIEALKNGAYGVTKNGEKVKFVGENSNNTFLYARYNSDGLIEDFLYYDLPHYFFGDRRNSIYNIIGLWVDKPEPFNLDRALAGAPIKNLAGFKTYILADVSEKCPNETLPFVGYIVRENGTIGNFHTHIDYLKKCTMWKEPEPVQLQLIADDLPKPIREFRDLDTVWYIDIGDYGYVPASTIRLGSSWLDWQYKRLKLGCCFATKEDAQANCDWLMNRGKYEYR